MGDFSGLRSCRHLNSTASAWQRLPTWVTPGAKQEDPHALVLLATTGWPLGTHATRFSFLPPVPQPPTRTFAPCPLPSANLALPLCPLYPAPTWHRHCFPFTQRQPGIATVSPLPSANLASPLCHLYPAPTWHCHCFPLFLFGALVHHACFVVLLYACM